MTPCELLVAWQCTGGVLGFRAKPEAVGRLQQDMKRVFRYAEGLGVSLVHVMTGEASRGEAKQTIIDNLSWAAEVASKARPCR